MMIQGRDPYGGQKPGMSNGVFFSLAVFFVIVVVVGLLLWVALK